MELSLQINDIRLEGTINSYQKSLMKDNNIGSDIIAMKKDNRLLLNTVMPVVLEAVTIISGFIVPRLILTHFGSGVNGLVQSITQFLSVISFLEMGIGSVIRYNLYKPLVVHDQAQISRVIVAANRFFRKLALFLLGYTLILMVTYPVFINREFDVIYTALLICSMSISSLAQYYFGQVNQILLTADQKGFIHYNVQIVTTIINTIATVILINIGASIHIVKLNTSIIYLMRPIYLQHYVNTHYNIDYGIKYDSEPIEQKWNGVAQHISAVILDQTDVIVLTILSTLSNVSIYAAYSMIVAGIKKLITTATGGIQAKLGVIIATGNKDKLQSLFSMTEWIIHTVAVFLFGCTLVLIVPFIMVYTKGVNDANYNVPLFAILITLANASHSLRLPYNMLILSAGHYRQTQHSYLIAAAMNIVVSVILVKIFGLIGVAFGTLLSMTYQTIWMAWYSYKNIVSRKMTIFWKQMIIDFICLLLIYYSAKIMKIRVTSFLSWVYAAIVYSIISGVVVITINCLFFREQLFRVIKRQAIN